MPVLSYVKSYRGDSVKIKVFVEKDLAPFDVTGCDFFFTAKSSVKDADGAAVVSADTSSGITIVDAVNGEIHIDIPSTDTDTLDPKNYWCDVQMKLPNNDIKTLGDIVWTILPDTTRRTS